MRFVVLFEYLRKVKFFTLVNLYWCWQQWQGSCSDVDAALTGNDRATVKLIAVIHAKCHSYRRDYCLLVDNKSCLWGRDLVENTHQFTLPVFILALCWTVELLWFSLTWHKHDFTPVMQEHTMNLIQMKCHKQICGWSRFWSLFSYFFIKSSKWLWLDQALKHSCLSVIKPMLLVVRFYTWSWWTYCNICKVTFDSIFVSSMYNIAFYYCKKIHNNTQMTKV